MSRNVPFLLQTMLQAGRNYGGWCWEARIDLDKGEGKIKGAVGCGVTVHRGSHLGEEEEEVRAGI